MNARVFEIAKILLKEILRKKDFYVALVLTALILGYAAQLRFYGTSSASRYLADVGLVLGFFFSVFLTAALAARQFPGERRDKTLHVLLARPVTRFEYLLGKFFGAWAAGAVASAAFFGAVAVVASTKAEPLSFIAALDTYLLFVLALGILTAVAVMLSLVLTPASNVSVTAAAYALINLYGFYWGQAAREAAPPLRWGLLGLYALVPHFEFFDLRQRFIHRWPAPPLTVLAFLALYAAVFIALFLFLARRLLDRKPLP